MCTALLPPGVKPTSDNKHIYLKFQKDGGTTTKFWSHEASTCLSTKNKSQLQIIAQNARDFKPYVHNTDYIEQISTLRHYERLTNVCNNKRGTEHIHGSRSTATTLDVHPLGKWRNEVTARYISKFQFCFGRNSLLQLSVTVMSTALTERMLTAGTRTNTCLTFAVHVTVHR
jgi:hypothetical protein